METPHTIGRAPDFSFAAIIESANDVVIVTEARGGTIVYVNAAFTALTGVAAADALGQSPGALLQGPGTDPKTIERVRDAVRSGQGIRTDILNYDTQGRAYWLDMNIVPLRDGSGNLTHFAAIERDVTEQREQQTELHRLATTDPLTGLSNRRSFDDALRREIRNAGRDGTPLCVLAFDLDHFKRINDEHGHAVGDAVLCEVARRCEGQLRSRDLLARVGGEEFLVLLPHTHLRLGHHVAERLRLAIAEAPMLALDVSVSVTASFGVAFHGAAHGDGKLALRCADRLMYAAKQAGRNRTCSEEGAEGMQGWSGARQAALQVHRLP